MGRSILGRPRRHVQDPFGYLWTIATRKEDLTTAGIHERMDALMKQFAAHGQSSHP